MEAAAEAAVVVAELDDRDRRILRSERGVAFHCDFEARRLTFLFLKRHPGCGVLRPHPIPDADAQSEGRRDESPGQPGAPTPGWRRGWWRLWIGVAGNNVRVGHGGDYINPGTPSAETPAGTMGPSGGVVPMSPDRSARPTESWHRPAMSAIVAASAPTSWSVWAPGRTATRPPCYPREEIRCLKSIP